MKIVDSHCHLNLLNLAHYNGDLGAAIDAAKTAGVESILCVCVDLAKAPEVIGIAEQFEQVWASVGLHPSDKVDREPREEDFLALIDHPKVVAVGETGLDYYYNKENLDVMRERFRVQIRVARAVNKPIIVHTREAREDTLTILREEKAEEVKGVMHCFTESLDMAQAAIEMGFYISFSGIITFKNAANVAAVAQEVPLERILIETDAPYLTPVPYRGKPNEPQYVRYVAEKIAELKKLSFDEVARQTTKNFYQLFKDVTPV